MFSIRHSLFDIARGPLAKGPRRAKRRGDGRGVKLGVEQLEDRRLLAVINWTNRGVNGGADNDNFQAVYGNMAEEARAIVDRAINDWEAAIIDFNFSSVGGVGEPANANTFDVEVSADASISGRGIADMQSIDPDSKPFAGRVRLDDDGGGQGWFFDITPEDDEEFVIANAAYRGSFNASGAAANDDDFYRTVTHEIGHLLGISNGAGLAIQGLLTDSGLQDANDNTEDLLILNGASGIVTFTTNGGLHVYEGPAVGSLTTHPNDLMNPGRTVGAPPVTRQLISPITLQALSDAYGYSVAPTASLASFTPADRFESDGTSPGNDTRGTAVVLGSPAFSTIDRLSIDSPTDEDWFEITANQTGKLILNALFDDVAGDGHEDLDLEIYDTNGLLVPIASSTTGDSDERIVVPVVGQERYAIRVFGVGPAINNVNVLGDDVNNYTLEIENFPAPVPTGVHLDPASDTGTSDHDNVTADTTPTFFIQTDVLNFVDANNNGLADAGEVDALDATEAGNGDEGIAIEISLVNTTTGTVVTGFAEPVVAILPEVYRFTPSAALTPGVYFVTARTKVFDGQTPAVMGRSNASEPLWITIDTAAPTMPAPDMLASSDAGMDNADNVTNIQQPAFTGVAEENAIVHVFAQSVDPATGLPMGDILPVGSGNVGTDNTDGIPNNDEGRWEVTVDPLTDGVYDITTRFEDAAGSLSDASPSLRIVIDTEAPNTPLLDLLDDTGRSDVDNITKVNQPQVFMTTTDPNVQFTQQLFTDNFKFRIFDRFEATAETLIYNSATDVLADNVTTAGDMFTSLTALTRTLPGGVGTLADGVHNLKLEVEDRAGNISHDFLLEIIVDTVTPPVAFGQPGITTDGLHATSDTGVLADLDTLVDQITADSTPTLWGVAEADSVVRVYLDLNDNGIVDLATDVLLGQTVAVPQDGNQAFADGYWELNSVIDLNDPLQVLPTLNRDGARHLLATAEDVAGNPMPMGGVIDEGIAQFTLFLDTQGPQVNGVFASSDRTYDLFDPKPSENGFSPLIDSIDIDFIDQPVRGEAGMVGVSGAIDVLLLFDDTGSFSSTAPTLVAAFPSLISNLQTALPGSDLAFGIARFEDFSSQGADERPFVLNQPILAANAVGFNTAINSALARNAPGGRGDPPESAIEALYQAATGLGFDGNDDGDTSDSGNAGLVATQTNPGSGGDVPTFGSFTPDGDVIASSGSLGGVGFRPGATHLILLATDTGFVFQSDIIDPYVGAGGITVAASQLQSSSRSTTPGGRGATIQETINALLALDGGAGVQVIGLGTSTNANSAPRQPLEALAQLTGAVNTTAAPIDSGIAGDAIAPGDPLFFLIDPNSGDNVANAISSAVTGAVGGTGFLYPAVNEALATVASRYQLVGDHVGPIAITPSMVEFVDNTVAGEIGKTTIRLHFNNALPDDRYTLTILDTLTDDPGNRLDGESNADEPQDNPTFPSGDGVPGGDFVARFTVDSRPEIGSFVAQNIDIDINGNFVWDPANGQIGNDATNVDLTFRMNVADPATGAIIGGGYGVHDLVFAGKFTNGVVPTSGRLFDQLAVFGWETNLLGQPVGKRWLVDTNSDGVINTAEGDIFSVQPLLANFDVGAAIPVAGNFDGNAANGDEVGLYNAGQWALDANHNFVIEPGEVLAQGNLLGHPIVGDFDGNGEDDLAVFNNNTFRFDMNTAGFDGFSDRTMVWGFPGVLDRPVATDMNQDGIDDIGLWVPRNSAQSNRPIAEWYFLISDAALQANGTINAINHPFTPVPFGDDLYAEFGDELALPIVGNFDPPVAAGSLTNQNVEESGDFDEDGDVDGSDFLAWQRGYGTISQSSMNDGDGNSDGNVDSQDLELWTSAVQASVAASPDFNHDGSVDGADLAVWETTLAAVTASGGAAGDSDGDGDTDGADFLNWQRNFQASALASTAAITAASTAAVIAAAPSPPPATLAAAAAPAPSAFELIDLSTVYVESLNPSAKAFAFDELEEEEISLGDDGQLLLALANSTPQASLAREYALPLDESTQQEQNAWENDALEQAFEENEDLLLSELF